MLVELRDAIRRRHYSFRSEKAYLGWVRRFIVYNRQRDPADMGAAEVRAYLSSRL